MQTLEDGEGALLSTGLVWQQLFARSSEGFPPLADEGVVENAEHPRPERASIDQRRARLPPACDRLSDQVICVRVVLRQPSGHAVQRTENCQDFGSEGILRNRRHARSLDAPPSEMVPPAGILLPAERVGTIVVVAASSAPSRRYNGAVAPLGGLSRT